MNVAVVGVIGPGLAEVVAMPGFCSVEELGAFMRAVAGGGVAADRGSGDAAGGVVAADWCSGDAAARTGAERAVFEAAV